MRSMIPISVMDAIYLLASEITVTKAPGTLMTAHVGGAIVATSNNQRFSSSHGHGKAITSELNGQSTQEPRKWAENHNTIVRVCDRPIDAAFALKILNRGVSACFPPQVPFPRLSAKHAMDWIREMEDFCPNNGAGNSLPGHQINPLATRHAVTPSRVNGQLRHEGQQKPRRLCIVRPPYQWALFTTYSFGSILRLRVAINDREWKSLTRGTLMAESMVNEACDVHNLLPWLSCRWQAT